MLLLARNWTLVCLTVVTVALHGCTRVSNKISISKLECGSDSPGDAQLVKIRGADGRELEASELEVLSWDDGHELTPVAVSAKGCFAKTENHDYIARIPKSAEALRVSAEELQDRTGFYLNNFSKQSVGLRCQHPAVSDRTNLLDFVQIQYPSEKDIMELSWSLLLPGTDQVQASGKQLYIAKQKGERLLSFQRHLADGIYRLELKVHNLLKNQTTETLGCELSFDNSKPSVALEFKAASPQNYGSYALVSPGQAFDAKVIDQSLVQNYVCWTALPDPDTSPNVGPLPECQWQESKPPLVAPAAGYWRLSLKSMDQAGNVSDVSSRDFLVYHKSDLEEVNLLTDSLDFHFFGDGYPLTGVLNALKAETIKRKLSTVYEQRMASRKAEEGLYKTLHQTYPFKFDVLDETPYGAAVSPDEKYFLIFTRQTGKVLVYSSETQQLVWSAQLGETPNRAVFSPDSKLIAVAGQKGRIMVWTSSGQNLYHFERGANTSLLKFSPNSKLLGSLSTTNNFSAWVIDEDDTRSDRLIYNKDEKGALWSFDWSENSSGFTLALGPKLYTYDLKNPQLEEALAVESNDQDLVYQVLTLKGSYHLTLSANSEQRAKRGTPDLSTTNLSLYTPDNKLLARTDIPGVIDRVRLSPDGKNLAFSGLGLKGVAILRDWTRVLTQEKPDLDSVSGISTMFPLEISGLYWGADNQHLVVGAYSGASAVLTSDGMIVSRMEGNNSARFGMSVIMSSKNLWVTGGQDKKLLFQDMDPAIFPSYISQTLIPGFSSDRDEKQFIAVERSYRDVKLVLLDEHLRLKNQWLLPGSETFAEQRARDFTPLFRSFKFLDENRIATADNASHIYIQDLNGQVEETIDFSLPNSVLVSFEFSPDRSHIAGGYLDGTVRLYDVSMKIDRFKTQSHAAAPYILFEDASRTAVNNLRFSSNQTLYSTGIDGRLLEYKADGSFIEQASLVGVLNNFKIGPDDSFLFGTRNSGAFFYADDVNAAAMQVKDHVEDALLGLDVSPTRSFFAGVSGQGLVQLWDKMGQWRFTMNPFFKKRADVVHFSSKQNGFWVGGYNRVLYVPLDAGEIYKRTCERLNGLLTSDPKYADICTAL